MTRRAYLTLKVMMNSEEMRIDGAPIGMFMAAEAVASTAIEHPEWDMDEEREFVEWEKS